MFVSTCAPQAPLVIPEHRGGVEARTRDRVAVSQPWACKLGHGVGDKRPCTFCQEAEVSENHWFGPAAQLACPCGGTSVCSERRSMPTAVFSHEFTFNAQVSLWDLPWPWR